MASREEYAQWLVDNAHLKGTDDFNVVAKAFEMTAEESLGFGDQVLGGVEVAGSLISSLPAQIAGGLSSLATGGAELLGGGSGEDALRAGVAAQERVQDAMTYTPRTAAGQRQMQGLATLLDPLAQGLETVQTSIGDATTERALQQGDSIGMAATRGGTAAALPSILLEIGPFALLRKAMPTMRFVDADGNPTQELRNELTARGLDYDDLVEEAIAALPDEARRTVYGGADPETSLRPVMAAQAKQGGEKRFAGQMQEDTGEGVPLARLVADPVAQRAIKQWDDPGLVQAIKTATPETRASMLQMLNLRRRIENNKRVAQTERPADFAGSAAIQRVNHLRTVANDARTELNKIAQKELRGVAIDTGPIEDAFRTSLEDLGVAFSLVDGVPKLNFDESIITANPASKAAITNLTKILAQGGQPDAFRFHTAKRQLDDLIDYNKKSSSGLSGEGLKVLKGIRAQLNESIRNTPGVGARYAEVNDTLSEILTVFDELDSIGGTRASIFDLDASQKYGQQFRKLFSNYGVRSDMVSALQNLDDLAAKYDGNFKTSVMDLAMFDSALNRRFGAVAETSFQGSIEAASRATAMANEARKGIGERVLDAGARAYDAVSGVNNERAYATMDELLRRQ